MKNRRDITPANLLEYIEIQTRSSTISTEPLSIDDIACAMDMSPPLIEPLIKILVQKNKVEYCGIDNICIRLKTTAF